MKKILLISLICMMTIFSACSTGSNKKNETEVTQWTPPASKSETKAPNYAGLNVQEEHVNLDPNKKPATSATKKPTKATEATESTAPLPTQGVPNPAGKPKIERAEGSFEEKDLQFILGENTFELNADIIEVFEAIGEDNSVREISSTKMAYEYEDFTIYTYIDDDDVERVMRVYTTSKNYETSKGVKVGDYASQLVKFYGKPYKQGSTYKHFGNSKNQLEFKYEDNRIISIAYILTL